MSDPAAKYAYDAVIRGLQRQAADFDTVRRHTQAIGGATLTVVLAVIQPGDLSFSISLVLAGLISILGVTTWVQLVRGHKWTGMIRAPQVLAAYSDETTESHLYRSETNSHYEAYKRNRDRLTRLWFLHNTFTVMCGLIILAWFVTGR